MLHIKKSVWGTFVQTSKKITKNQKNAIKNDENQIKPKKIMATSIKLEMIYGLK